MGTVLREQNALPRFIQFAIYLTAKATIDNCQVGRAAKGENPLLNHELSEIHARSVTRFVNFSSMQFSDDTLLQRNNFPLLCAKTSYTKRANAIAFALFLLFYQFFNAYLPTTFIFQRVHGYIKTSIRQAIRPLQASSKTQTKART